MNNSANEKRRWRKAKEERRLNLRAVHNPQLLNLEHSGPYNFGTYFVALFDLVGQSNQLSKLSRLPRNAHEEEEFMSAARASVGSVIKFREMISQFFYAFLDIIRKRPYFSELDPAAKKEYERRRKVTISCQGISDTVVVYFPLMNVHGTLQFDAIGAAMLCCNSLMLTSFARGFAPRGAVEMGIGVEPFRGEIYGDVLNRAAALEKAAGYPRIVVGEQLVNILTEISNKPETDRWARVERFAMAECLSWICNDADGRQIVDYLGSSMTKGIPVEKYPDLFRAARKFIADERGRFSKDPILGGRYDRLAQYFASRGQETGE